MEGWIKLHRSIMENGLWLSDPFTRAQAWVDLLMLANHKDGMIRVRGIPVSVKRGQVGWSEVKLSERWKWSRGKVRRFLKELKTVQQIEQQADNVSSFITITNYEQYQDVSTADETTSDTANGQQTDSKRYTNKNDKKKKNTIDWSSADGWSNHQEHIQRWVKTYPACDVDRQLLEMHDWLIANPMKAKKSNWARFVTNWLKRAQDRGGDLARSKQTPFTPPRQSAMKGFG